MATGSPRSPWATPPQAFLVLGAALAVLWCVEACSLPPGGCVPSNCLRLKTLSPPRFRSGNTQDKAIGRYAGGFNYYWNTTGNSGKEWESVRGGPYVNWEVFPNVEAEFVVPSVAALSVTNLGDCCSLCARTANCTIYQFFTNKNIASIPGIMGITPSVSPGGAYVSSQQCYLLSGGSRPEDGPYGGPYSGTKTIQTTVNQLIAPSWVGGLCNPNATVTDDPHFVGAYGTRFDFNGKVGRVFNLISDQDLHMNIKLGGYLDTRTYGATLLQDGKAVRTWITSVGLVWRDGGVSHTLALTARSGKVGARGLGYLESAVLDGQPVPVPSATGTDLTMGSLTLSFTGVERRGPYELDTYTLRVGEDIDITLKMRPAHPLLQMEDSAFVHFNVHINKFAATPKVHGVLGQTFRNSGRQYFKAMEYSMLVKLLGSPIAADGASGEGFLEGTPSDYEMESLLSTNGKFSSYAGF